MPAEGKRKRERDREREEKEKKKKIMEKSLKCKVSLVLIIREIDLYYTIKTVTIEMVTS